MSVIAKGRHSEEIQRGVTKNVGLNAKVQWIAGIYPRLDSLVSYLFEKRQATVCLQKHKLYNFLHCRPIDFATPSLWLALRVPPYGRLIQINHYPMSWGTQLFYDAYCKNRGN